MARGQRGWLPAPRPGGARGAEKGLRGWGAARGAGEQLEELGNRCWGSARGAGEALEEPQDSARCSTGCAVPARLLPAPRCRCRAVCCRLAAGSVAVQLAVKRGQRPRELLRTFGRAETLRNRHSVKLPTEPFTRALIWATRPLPRVLLEAE